MYPHVPKEVAERLDASRREYVDQFEVVQDAKGFRAVHKKSGLGMWSHDVAIEEAKRKQAQGQ